MNVDVTPLPGIGVRQDFVTRSGRRVGVISYRDGHSELLVYRADDPDACSASIPLSAEEATTLASLLGAPHLVGHIAGQHANLDGVETHQLVIVPGSPYDGRTMGEAALRSRTGVSIVAIVRRGEVNPSPRPDFRFQGRDLVVVVGTDEGLAQAAQIFERG